MSYLKNNKSSEDIHSSDDKSAVVQVDGKLESVETITAQADSIAMTTLSLLFIPLLFGYAMFSLIFEKHSSWYRWVITTLTSSVYTGGFIIMCPQLFINYKLKSVAHLPWKYLAYKFINTFIDDLFAFVIKMPTMHRISCFRDDIIFVIYLYQRWIYNIDKSRPMEK